MGGDLNKLLKKYSPEVQNLALQARELEGAGKNMRHIKIDNTKLLNSRAVKALIKAAAKYQPAE